MIFSFSQFALLTLSTLPASLHAFLLISIHMVFGRWFKMEFVPDIVPIFLVLPHHETVQFGPSPPDVSKPRFLCSDVSWNYLQIVHETIYKLLLWPCKVQNFHSLRLFVCPRPLASCGLRLLQGLLSSGTSSFGALPPLCATFYVSFLNVEYWININARL